MATMQLPSLAVPLCESPFPGDPEGFAAWTDAERSAFRALRRDGYAVVELDDRTTALAEAIPEAVVGRFGPAARLQNLWSQSDPVRSLAITPQILRLLRLLYGREPVPFQTLNFDRGSQQRTHSDAFHFHCVPERFLCAVWVPLEDIDEDNGPLHVYPGSHRLPLLHPHDIGLPAGPDQYPLYEAFVKEYLYRLGMEKRVLTLRRGQAVLWAANVYHGGDPVRDRRRTRHSQVTHYYFRDCLYYTPCRSAPCIGHVHLRRIVDLRTGETVPHVFNGAPLRCSADQVFWQRPSLTYLTHAVASRFVAGRGARAAL